MHEFDKTAIYLMAEVVRNKKKNQVHYLGNFLGEIPLMHIFKERLFFHSLKYGLGLQTYQN